MCGGTSRLHGLTNECVVTDEVALTKTHTVAEGKDCRTRGSGRLKRERPTLVQIYEHSAENRARQVSVQMCQESQQNTVSTQTDALSAQHNEHDTAQNCVARKIEEDRKQ